MNLCEKNAKIPLLKLKLDLPEWRGISCSWVVIFKLIEASFLRLMYTFPVIPIQRLMNLSFSETKQVDSTPHMETTAKYLNSYFEHLREAY